MSEHLFGKVVWYELRTRQPARAREFYAELVGWSVRESPTPGGEGSYVMFAAGERTLAGISPLREDEAGTPPSWLPYVSVEDVDATAARAEAGGGRVLVPPMDVFGMLRLTVIADPQGGVIAAMRSAESDPPDEDQGPGGFVWTEYFSPDVPASLAFYRAVFGWDVQEMAMPAGTYHVLVSCGKPRAGLMAAPTPEVPPSWLPYVGVADVDATVALATARGAEVCSPPMDIPEIGRFAVLADPEGAVIAVMKPAEWEG